MMIPISSVGLLIGTRSASKALVCSSFIALPRDPWVRRDTTFYISCSQPRYDRTLHDRFAIWCEAIGKETKSLSPRGTRRKQTLLPTQSLNDTFVNLNFFSEELGRKYTNFLVRYELCFLFCPMLVSRTLSGSCLNPPFQYCVVMTVQRLALQ